MRFMISGQRPEPMLHTLTGADGKFTLFTAAGGRALVKGRIGDTEMSREVFLVLGKQTQVRL
jgi:hypothetical protein